MKYLGEILFYIGLGATLIAGFDVWLLLRGAHTPQRVTLAALGAADGTHNSHLTVTDFSFGDGVVVHRDRSGNWQRVWVPLLLPDGQWTERPVIAHTKTVSDQEELDELLKLKTVTGVVSNGMQSLGSVQRKQFAVSYPDANLRGAIALEIGRRFPSPYVAYPVTMLGLLAMVSGIVLYFGLPGRRTSQVDPPPRRP